MRYPGGKSGSGVAQLIINQQPPHVEYVEPFLGGGAVLRLKRRAALSVGIDLDASVVARVAGIVGCDGAVQLHVGDGISYLRGRRWWTESLVYCDPPYLMTTRSSPRRLYRYELDEPGHIALLDVLVRLPCLVMISGYDSELYRRRLSSWRVVRYRTMTRGGRMADECLWCNFPEPVELHDYRFVGRDYRERERIRRKRARWVAMLSAMPVLERAAVVSDLIATASDVKTRQDALGEAISAPDRVSSVPAGGPEVNTRS
jgi:DNA adenine methylase